MGLLISMPFHKHAVNSSRETMRVGTVFGHSTGAAYRLSRPCAALIQRCRSTRSLHSTGKKERNCDASNLQEESFLLPFDCGL